MYGHAEPWSDMENYLPPAVGKGGREGDLWTQEEGGAALVSWHCLQGGYNLPPAPRAVWAGGHLSRRNHKKCHQIIFVAQGWPGLLFAQWVTWAEIQHHGVNLCDQIPQWPEGPLHQGCCTVPAPWNLRHHRGMLGPYAALRVSLLSFQKEEPWSKNESNLKKKLRDEILLIYLC